MNTTTVSTATRAWVGVASREHVQIGRDGGFAQFCHGKSAPAKRPRRGDLVLYYSPNEVFGKKAPCQRFTALGVVEDDVPEQVEQFPGFLPWRRSVRWVSNREAEIRALVDRLSFIDNKQAWGSKFRFGFLEIPLADAHLIAREMDVDATDLRLTGPRTP